MAEKPFARLIEKVRSLIRLNVENVKLMLAEKLTLALSSIIMGVIALFFGLIVFFFVSIALGLLLAQAVGLFWAFMIIAGAYLVIMLLLILLRRPLFINPIARALTRKLTD